jgi:hypothetical protein
MKKDIEMPEVSGVYIAIVSELGVVEKKDMECLYN